MIRVLQFANRINRHDFIDVVVQGIDLERFEVGVCVATEESNIACPVYAEHVRRWVIPWTPRRGLLTAATRLARVLRVWRADVLHTHHYYEAVIGLLATCLYPRTKLVVGRHYSDAIYRSTDGWRRTLLLSVERSVNGHANKIVVPSQFIYDLLVNVQKVPREKLALVPYCFDPDKYRYVSSSEAACLRSDLGLGSRFCIASFGRLHEEKGHRFLIRAASELRELVPGCIFLLIGEGPERVSLERQVDEAGLRDTVRLLGWRKDVAVIFAIADVVVQPTLQEAFSQAMAEALWFSKPLVMTDVSGASDLINDGENGMLIPPGDVAAIVSAVARLYAEPGLRDRLASEARTSVASRLSVENVIGRYEAVYEAAVGM